MEELAESGTAYPKGNRSIMPVISCRRTELNHYQGQRVNPFKKLVYASEHWGSRKTIGDYFSFNGYKKALSTSFHENVVSEKTRDRLDPDRPQFQSFDQLDSRLLNSLKNLGLTHPTNIQQLSLRDLLKGQSGILAAETGNGKTLAFLLPLVQRVLRLKEAIGQVESDRQLTYLNRPLAVVVAPSRELAHQIFQMAKDLCTAASDSSTLVPSDASSHFKALGLDFRLALGGSLTGKMAKGLRPTDVVVGSAGAVDKMFKRKFYRSGSCSMLVFDEADTMLDDSFRSVSYRLMSELTKPKDDGPISHGDIQVIFSGATFPHYIHEIFSDFLDDGPNGGDVEDKIKTYRTGQLHRVPHHIYQKFIRAPKTDRIEYLMDAIDNDLARKHSVMVFSNKGSTSNYIYHFLNEKGISCERFNSSVYWRTRYQTLERFRRGEVQVLSCTDLASRGLNTLNVHHVVNYDFPSNAADYLHRVGRVGRVGSKFNPKVTSLVCGQTSVKVVQDLELAVRMHREIENTDGNIARVIKNRVQEEEGFVAQEQF